MGGSVFPRLGEAGPRRAIRPPIEDWIPRGHSSPNFEFVFLFEETAGGGEGGGA